VDHPAHSIVNERCRPGEAAERAPVAHSGTRLSAPKPTHAAEIEGAPLALNQGDGIRAKQGLIARRIVYPLAAEYQFSAADQRRYSRQFFAATPDFFAASHYARLRAGGVYDPLVFVAAATHAWREADDDFTEPFAIPQRRIAALLGCDADTVTASVRRLAANGHIAYDPGRYATGPGRFSISDDYLADEPPFIQLPASAFYNGWVRVLPLPAAKLLMFGLLGCVHVRDEAAALSSRTFDFGPLGAMADDSDEEKLELAAQARTLLPSRIAQRCGIGVSTWPKVLPFLTNVESGQGLPGPLFTVRGAPYERNRVYIRRNGAAWSHAFDPRELNDTDSLRELRSRLWPWLRWRDCRATV
jgi:hypothetical protein